MAKLDEITTVKEAAAVLWQAYGEDASREAWDRMVRSLVAQVDDSVRFWSDVVDTVEAFIHSTDPQPGAWLRE